MINRGGRRKERDDGRERGYLRERIKKKGNKRKTRKRYWKIG